MFLLFIFKLIFKKFKYKIIFLKSDWLGIGDWGLGIGDWGLGPIPNPQFPNPNPQTPKNYKKISNKIL